VRNIIGIYKYGECPLQSFAVYKFTSRQSKPGVVKFELVLNQTPAAVSATNTLLFSVWYSVSKSIFHCMLFLLLFLLLNIITY